MPRILVSWNRNFSRPSGFLVLGVGVKSAKTLIRKDVEFKNLCVCVFLGDFLRILPWDSSPSFTTIWDTIFWNFLAGIEHANPSNKIFQHSLFPQKMGVSKNDGKTPNHPF